MPYALVSGSPDSDSASLKGFSFDESNRGRLIKICIEKKYDLDIDFKPVLKAGKPVNLS